MLHLRDQLVRTLLTSGQSEIAEQMAQLPDAALTMTSQFLSTGPTVAAQHALDDTRLERFDS